MHHQNRDVREQFQYKIPVRNTVDRIQRDPFKAEFFRFVKPVRRISRPCKGTASDRRNVDPPACVGQTVDITQQHHDISHQMMPERYRLRALQMRIARHDQRFVLLCLIRYRPCKQLDGLYDPVGLFTQIQAQIKRDLIVAAAGGMELLTGFTDTLRQDLLDKRMNILCRRIKIDLTAIQILQDPRQAVDQHLCLRFGYDACRSEHRGMRHAAGNILTVEPFVERKR